MFKAHTRPVQRPRLVRHLQAVGHDARESAKAKLEKMGYEFVIGFLEGFNAGAWASTGEERTGDDED